MNRVSGSSERSEHAILPVRVATLLLSALALSGCARAGFVGAGSPGFDVNQSQGPYQVGLASYYHDSLAGNLTANGETYAPSVVSAAHRTLPFGTVVDVVRRDGRGVRVRVNDRGPFVDGRIIDLSRQAASLLGSVQEGVVEVALFLVYVPAVPERVRH